MTPRINVITLAVDNLQRSVMFYRDGMGLVTDDTEHRELPYGRIAHFQLQPGLKLALWSREEVGGERMQQCLPLFALSHAASSKTEVFILMARAERAGAQIIQQASQTYWGGYAGYFRDPDSYLWEVAWTPTNQITESQKVEVAYQ
jgi:catechol 2,3-dioxygenase-like lactoylglutathione lyase family enzyme